MAASHINSSPVKQQSQIKNKIVDGHAHYTLKANHRLSAVGMQHKKAPERFAIPRLFLIFSKFINWAVNCMLKRPCQLLYTPKRFMLDYKSANEQIYLKLIFHSHICTFWEQIINFALCVKFSTFRYSCLCLI